MTKAYDHTDAQVGRRVFLFEDADKARVHQRIFERRHADSMLLEKHDPLDTSLLPERIGY